MSAREWEKQYCGTFEVDHRLFDLGLQYHNRCDAYDDFVCTGPIVDGEVMPADHREMAMINRNAADVRRDVIQLGVVMGYTREQVIDAIQRAALSAEGSES